MPLKKLIKIVSLLLISANIYNLIQQESYSEESSKFTHTENEYLNDSEINKEIKSEYVLGPGDGLFIKFSGIDLFSGTYFINEEGFLFLPEVNDVFASKKTLKELRKELNQKYKSYIIQPDVKIKISKYRDVNVYISGEVKNPGLYLLNYKTESRENSLIQNNSNSLSPYSSLSINSSLKAERKIPISPRLFDALKISNGFTNFADLSKVKVIRNAPSSMGSGKIETTIDFLQLITNGDQTKNIRLRDGDYVIVPKTDKLLKNQFLEIHKTNLTPNKIIVYITGNVLNPGKQLLEQGVTLNQAIASAGGESYFTGKIKHLRFDEMGNTEKKIFYFNSNKKVNSKRNPILLNGDIIEVNRTALGKTFRAIQEVAPPLLTGYGVYSIFN